MQNFDVYLSSTLGFAGIYGGPKVAVRLLVRHSETCSTVAILATDRILKPYTFFLVEQLYQEICLRYYRLSLSTGARVSLVC
jgi:hypothetical protein